MTLPPLPTRDLGAVRIGRVDQDMGYSDEAMRVYADQAVAAERERIAAAMRNIVRMLDLPDKQQYLLDEKHTERRMLLALADATVANSWPNVGIEPPER